MADIDIKKLIDELAEKIKSDPALLKKFKADPVAALEGIIGIDLPDDSVKAVASGIKAKIAVGGISETLGKFL